MIAMMGMTGQAQCCKEDRVTNGELPIVLEGLGSMHRPHLSFRDTRRCRTT